MPFNWVFSDLSFASQAKPTREKNFLDTMDIKNIMDIMDKIVKFKVIESKARSFYE